MPQISLKSLTLLDLFTTLPPGLRRGRGAAGPEISSMTRETGLPRAPRARQARASALAAMILLAVISTPLAGGESPERSMELIARAFRTRSVDPLTSILPPEGKVYLSLRSVGGEAGYFGRSQVYFIFKKIFSQYETAGFEIRSQRDDEGATPTSRQAYCVGVWTYRRQGGHGGEVQIHFVLTSTGDRW